MNTLNYSNITKGTVGTVGCSTLVFIDDYRWQTVFSKLVTIPLVLYRGVFLRTES